MDNLQGLQEGDRLQGNAMLPGLPYLLPPAQEQITSTTSCGGDDAAALVDWASSLLLLPPGSGPGTTSEQVMAAAVVGVGGEEMMVDVSGGAAEESGGGGGRTAGAGVGREQAVSGGGKGGGGARGRGSRKASRPRFAFQTKSENDVLDDGYRWRKYGQKAVKNSAFPRSYYRCTHHTCNVKKQVQRLAKDTSIVVTTYEGVHNHPCEKLMEALTPILRQLQFLSQL